MILQILFEMLAPNDIVIDLQTMVIQTKIELIIRYIIAVVEPMKSLLVEFILGIICQSVVVVTKNEICEVKNNLFDSIRDSL